MAQKQIWSPRAACLGQIKCWSPRPYPGQLGLQSPKQPIWPRSRVELKSGLFGPNNVLEFPKSLFGSARLLEFKAAQMAQKQIWSPKAAYLGQIRFWSPTRPARPSEPKKPICPKAWSSKPQPRSGPGRPTNWHGV